MSLILRPYQIQLRDDARAVLRRGVRRLLVTMPTGAGKTVLIAAMLSGAVARGKRAWFCVHRKELLEQSVTTFIEAADLETGIIAAGYPARPKAPVQVCSIQSLKSRLGTLQPPDLLVTDECHHTTSPSWAAVANALPRAVHIGLTATPQRLDGQGLAPFYDEMLCGPSVADLIALGWLSPYTLYAPPEAVNLDGVHRLGGDYNKQEVGERMDGSTIVGDAVSHYQAHCAGQRALVFAWSVKASRELAAQFVAAGVEARHVDGETPKDERAASMAAFRAGRVQVLCNVELFGEGVDVPAIDAVFLLRPTQSLSVYLQQVGRGLRPQPGKVVKIFDHVGNWSRHGLPDDPRVWSLAGREKKSRDSSAAMGRRCGTCFGVSPIGATACRYCGLPFPVQPREIERVDGELQPMGADEIQAMRRLAREKMRHCKTLGDWKDLARVMGFKGGWAFHMMRHADHQRMMAPEAFTEQPP